MRAVSGLQRAQSGGEPATGTHPCRVRVGEAGVEWGVCLYWVVRGWNPMWGWWEVCQRQGGVGWRVGEGGVVVGVWSRGVGGEGVPCQMAIAARRSHGKATDDP
jgi:hypothetical protein